jgi:hypothetical protein
MAGLLIALGRITPGHFSEEASGGGGALFEVSVQATNKHDARARRFTGPKVPQVAPRQRTLSPRRGLARAGRTTDRGRLD